MRRVDVEEGYDVPTYTVPQWQNDGTEIFNVTTIVDEQPQEPVSVPAPSSGDEIPWNTPVIDTIDDTKFADPETPVSTPRESSKGSPIFLPFFREPSTPDPMDVFPDPVGNPDPNFTNTMENNPIGTNPSPVSGLSPLEQVNTLMDLFNQDLGTTHAEPYIQPPQPGTTVIPPAVYDSGGGSWVIWLGVLGIVVTLVAHWYFNRKR